MATYYFATIVPTKEGGFFVIFPDIPEAVTQGEDFADAMEMAKDILEITVEEYAAARRELPPSTGPSGARAWWNAHRNDDGVGEGEAHIQAFALPNTDMTPVRVNISLPKSVLAEVDAKAAAAGYTRSGFLVKAAQAYQLQR